MSDAEFVLYLRKSKGRAGIPRQERECRAHADRIGATIVAVFTDEDSTAYTKPGAKRARRDDGYAPMLEMVRRTPGLGVLAWHADRLHRDVGEGEDFIAVCATGHNPVETPRSGSYDLTTPTGRKRFRMDVVDAAYEVDHQIERRESAKVEAATEGRYLGGRRPFGFDKDGVTHRPAEADAVDSGSGALLVGVSLNQIARDWCKQGLLTSGGKDPTGMEVRRILARPRNAGISMHRGAEVGQTVWLPVLCREEFAGQPLTPELEERWRAAAVEKFRAVQGVLSDPGRRTTPGPERRWLGSGLYLCGQCGTPMKAGGGGSAHPKYRCSVSHHVVREAAPLDEFVTAAVLERLANPANTEGLMPKKADRTLQMHVQALALRGKISEALDMWRSGEIDSRADYVRVRDELKRELAVIEEGIARAAEANALDGLAGNPDVAKVWPTLPVSRRRAVLEAVAVVTVHRTPKGRTPGWQPGKPYFNRNAVTIEWI